MTDWVGGIVGRDEETPVTSGVWALSEIVDRMHRGRWPHLEIGDAIFTTPGTHEWVCPPRVTSVSVVCIGAGGGGASHTSGASGAGGGGLGWKNDIPVTPGETYTVVVGAGGIRSTGIAGSGGDSYFIDPELVAGLGGAGGFAITVGNRQPGGGWVGDGGGNGGDGGAHSGTSDAGGGGGAGGYTGDGGAGGGLHANSPNHGQDGSGGGGGGGGRAGSADTGGAGGGVSVFGEGPSGVGGVESTSDAGGGGGGSWGQNASEFGTTSGNFYSVANNPAIPGRFGGGASGSDLTTSVVDGSTEVSEGADGAVRLVWGTGLHFPDNAPGLGADPLLPEIVATHFASGNNITLPSSIEEGDLIILNMTAQTNSYPTAPADFTVQVQQQTSSTYWCSQRVVRKIAETSDAGRAISLTAGSNNAIGCVVIRGHDHATGDIPATNATSISASAAAPPVPSEFDMDRCLLLHLFGWANNGQLTWSSYNPSLLGYEVLTRTGASVTENRISRWTEGGDTYEETFLAPPPSTEFSLTTTGAHGVTILSVRSADAD